MRLINNFIDSVVGTFKPESALRRQAARAALQVFNTGYSEGGATKSANWVKGWVDRGGSVVDDQELNLETLRQRSRALYMNAPIARAAINRKSVNVVGPGLRLRSTPDAEVLGLSPEEAIRFARVREREFELWARSKDCEASGLENFSDVQQLAYLSWQLSGDAIILLLDEEPTDQPYNLRLQLIESDRVCNPPAHARDPLFHDGVEINENGRVVAYHVCSIHPHAIYNAGRPEWVRVPVRSETGRLNVIHLLTRERPDQYRGIPLLAPVIESCKQLSRYSFTELSAAVVSSFVTILVKSKTPEFTLENAFARRGSDEAFEQPDPVEIPMGSMSMIALNPDEDATMMAPNRPNDQFGAFVEMIAKEIGAATDIPEELLLLKFTSSYTAARAALLEFWKRLRIDRSDFAANFCDPIAQIIFEEGLLQGRLDAAGYWDDYSIQAAWLAGQWNGQAMGQMNPKDEIAAAKSRIDAGLSTHSKESMEISGLEFDDIIQETEVEWARLLATGNPNYAKGGATDDD